MPDRNRSYVGPPRLELNRWALDGSWTAGEQSTTLDEPGGRIICRFRGRDVNLVMGCAPGAPPVGYRVLVDGKPPRGDHGLDVDERGDGVLTDERLHQLIRQNAPIRERTVEITFAGAGARAYVFTFG